MNTKKMEILAALQGSAKAPPPTLLDRAKVVDEYLASGRDILKELGLEESPKFQK